MLGSENFFAVRQKTRRRRETFIKKKVFLFQRRRRKFFKFLMPFIKIVPNFREKFQILDQIQTNSPIKQKKNTIIDKFWINQTNLFWKNKRGPLFIFYSEKIYEVGAIKVPTLATALVYISYMPYYIRYYFKRKI